MLPQQKELEAVEKIISPSRSIAFIEPSFPFIISWKIRGELEAEFVLPGFKTNNQLTLRIFNQGDLSVIPFQTKDLGQYATQVKGGVLIEAQTDDEQYSLVMFSKQIVNIASGRAGFDGVNMIVELSPISHFPLLVLQSQSQENTNFLSQIVKDTKPAMVKGRIFEIKFLSQPPVIARAFL